jgi:hypothetical protein
MVCEARPRIENCEDDDSIEKLYHNARRRRMGVFHGNASSIASSNSCVSAYPPQLDHQEDAVRPIEDFGYYPEHLGEQEEDNARTIAELKDTLQVQSETMASILQTMVQARHRRGQLSSEQLNRLITLTTMTLCMTSREEEDDDDLVTFIPEMDQSLDGFDRFDSELYYPEAADSELCYPEIDETHHELGDLMLVEENHFQGCR